MWSKEDFSLMAVAISTGYATYWVFSYKWAVDLGFIELMGPGTKIPITHLLIVWLVCILCGPYLKNIILGYIVGSLGGLIYFLWDQKDFEFVYKKPLAEIMLDRYGYTDLVVSLLICASAVFVAAILGAGVYFLFRFLGTVLNRKYFRD